MNTSKGIAKTFKGTLDEAKKQNLVLDYKIMIGEAATPQDFNILLMVESPNMAALDNAREKFDPIARKITGSPSAQLATATNRLSPEAFPAHRPRRGRPPRPRMRRGAKGGHAAPRRPRRGPLGGFALGPAPRS